MTIKTEQGFSYIEQGEGEILLFLHGLFGALSNWDYVVKQVVKDYKVVIPLIPIYQMPIKQASLEGLVQFLESFTCLKKFKKTTLIGNSLGGHIGLIYTLNNPTKVDKLILTGSSGLYENTMGGSFIKRNNYDYIAERVRYTFYDPRVVEQAYIDEVFSIVKDRSKVIRILAIAKSAQRHNLAYRLPNIQTATLLIWGLNDTITPPLVAHEFNSRIPNSILRFIDHCCHVPMMEHPDEFTHILNQFLEEKICN